MQHPQQLGLHGQAHGVQLVQEQGAPVGLLKVTGLVLAAGKAALGRAEEQTFDQRLRDGGAVDGHEFFPRPGAGAVDALGKDLFPRARLSHQHDGAVLGGHPLGQLYGGAELWTAADDVFKGIAGEADGGGVVSIAL